MTEVNTPTIPRVPNKPKTPMRSMRVPDDVWKAAQAEAERRGESVTAAVVKFLKRYGKGSK